MRHSLPEFPDVEFDLLTEVSDLRLHPVHPPFQAAHVLPRHTVQVEHDANDDGGGNPLGEFRRPSVSPDEKDSIPEESRAVWSSDAIRMHSRWKSSTVTSSGPDLMLADDHKVATQSRNPRRAVDLTRRTPGSIRGALARAGPGASEEPPLRKRKPRVPPSRRASAGFRLVLSFPPSTPPSIPRPTPNADRRRTNFQAPHPQKTPNQGLPPGGKSEISHRVLRRAS